MQYLAADLGLSLSPSLAGGTNYALGGERTGTLHFGALEVLPDFGGVLGQASFVAFFGSLPSSALYVLNGGGNDVRKASELVGTLMSTAGDAILAMSEGAANLAASVAALAAAGATDFVVSNLPDVGRAPAFVGLGSIAAGFATDLVTAFNAALVTEIAASRSANPLLNIIDLDTFTLTNALLDDPSAFGFSNGTDPCALLGAGCVDPDTYVFWDGIHPTTATHRLSADVTLAALGLTPVPVPAAIWMFASAIGAVLGWRRRRIRRA